MEFLQFQNIIAIIIAYLIGSIPTSVWLGKYFYGIDVREYGSGNAGATNTIRTLGLKAGIPVLLFDAFKGWLAAMSANIYFLSSNFYDNDIYFVNFQVILGIVAMIGHIFPIYIGFKGGKGIATFTGVLVAIFPRAVLCLTILYFLVLFITKYVSLASIVTSIAFPVSLLFVFRSHHSTQVFIVFSICTSFLVLFTHKKNIVRLIKGEEPKFVLKNIKNRAVQNKD